MGSEKRSETIGIMVTPAIRSEIEKIAGDEERSLSWIGGVLLERGLEAFRKDGLLRPKKDKLNLKAVDKSRRPAA